MQTNINPSTPTTRWTAGRIAAAVAGALLLLIAACVAGWIFLIRPMQNANVQPAANRADAALMAETANGETAEISSLRQNKQYVMIFVGTETKPIETYEISPSLGAVRAQIVNGTVILFNQAGEAIHTITRATAEQLPADLPAVLDQTDATSPTLALNPPAAAPTAAPITHDRPYNDNGQWRWADGQPVNANTLAERIGGDVAGWSPRCDDGSIESCSTWGYWNKLSNGETVATFVPNHPGQSVKVTYWGGFVPNGRDFRVQNHAEFNGGWAEFTKETDLNDTTFTIEMPGLPRSLKNAVTGPIDGLGVHLGAE